MSTTANLFELHYYLKNDNHLIDATLRNRCESELLAILYEAAFVLSIDIELYSCIPSEGGFRDFWKALGKNNNQITIFLVLTTIILSRIPTTDPEIEKLEKELKNLTIEETKLNIEKLKLELQSLSPNEVDQTKINKAAKIIDKNLKIVKRRSNLYTLLTNEETVEKIGFSLINSEDGEYYSDERQIPRDNFFRFIISSDTLRAEVDENAMIEIISPVLKEGRFKWKGVYNETVISFNMNDSEFKEDVLFDNVAFKHGTCIRCVLRKAREIDEVGDIKITGFNVKTVLEVVEGDAKQLTKQGIRYRHNKTLKDSQQDFFG
ncbi:MAG: regulator of replication initiation timing [Oleiphilaceae bacterium]